MEKKTAKINAFIERKMGIGATTAKKEGAIFICAEFKKIEKLSFKGVKVNIPDYEDQYLKRVESLKVVTLNDPYKAKKLPAYYRRGFYTDGVLITRNMFGLGLENFGSSAVADVDVVIKTDYKSGEPIESIIIDIRITPGVAAEFELKLGSPVGQLVIPGTGKYIGFKKIEAKKERPVLVLRKQTA